MTYLDVLWSGAWVSEIIHDNKWHHMFLDRHELCGLSGWAEHYHDS